MNLQEIEKTIAELENADTTYSNCQKLASLYIVQKHYNSQTPKLNNIVVKEFNDILPMYSEYCKIKRKYQSKELPSDAVIDAIKNVSREIKEFIKTLYANVDTVEEKEELTNMIADLKTLY